MKAKYIINAISAMDVMVNTNPFTTDDSGPRAFGNALYGIESALNHLRAQFEIEEMEIPLEKEVA